MINLLKEQQNGKRGPAIIALFLLISALASPFCDAFSPLSKPVTQQTKFSTITPTALNARNIYVGEEGRKNRREVFTHEKWVDHRDPKRIFNNLKTLFDSAIAETLLKEVSSVVAVAVFVLLWNSLAVNGYDDFGGVHHPNLLEQFGYQASAISLPLQPFTLASPSLGLLLIFRTNNSYARWWEARKLWGSIVNHTRNIMRVSSGYQAEDDSLERLSLAVWSFPRSLTYHLLGEEDKEDYEIAIRERLDPEYAQDLIDARHKPTRVLFEITRICTELPLNDFVRMEVDRSTTVLCDAMGACERIFSTPIPLVYTRHASRFVTLWCLLLPTAMYGPFSQTWNHIGLLPASFFIAFFFFGIEELSIQLEEPFSVLPLHSISNNSIGKSCDDYVDWYKQAAREEQEALAAQAGMDSTAYQGKWQ